MILEQLTFNSFGYWPKDLKPQSHKLVIATCKDCGLLRIIPFRRANTYCTRCRHKGERSAKFGKPMPDETKKKLSKSLKGHISWNEGLTKDTNASLKRISERMLVDNPMNRLESRRRVSESNIGRVSWCRGLTKDMDDRVARIALAMTGRHHSESSKRKMSKSRKGKKTGKDNINWKGGITPIYLAIRLSTDSKKWRNDILRRDNYKCQACQDNKALIVHHIHSLVNIISVYQIKTMEDALKCGILWNISNGATLCTECHKKIHKRAGEVILPISLLF